VVVVLVALEKYGAKTSGLLHLEGSLVPVRYLRSTPSRYDLRNTNQDGNQTGLRRIPFTGEIAGQSGFFDLEIAELGCKI
jgi:hypothetical protein